jgi:transposase
MRPVKEFNYFHIFSMASYLGQQPLHGRRQSGEIAAIVAESVEDGALVSHVARRHGLTPQQLFAWRRQACRRTEIDPATPAFAPVFVGAPSVGQSPDVGENKAGDARPHSIELDIDGSSVWIWPAPRSRC